MKINGLSKLVPIYLLLTLVPVTGFAINSNETANADSEDIEKIEVKGEKWLTTLRSEYRQAKFNFYDMYNATVDEDQFKMRCERVAIIGSRIKRSECLRQYFLDKREELQEQITWNWRFNGGSLTMVNHRDVRRAVKEKDEFAKQDLVDKLSANPELLEQFRDMLKKEDKLKERHIEVWGKYSLFYEEEVEVAAN